MSEELKSTIKDPEIGESIRREAAYVLGIAVGDLQADYEHGQWWITQISSGAQWGAHDQDASAIGDKTPYCFEQVTLGDTEW